MNTQALDDEIKTLARAGAVVRANRPSFRSTLANRATILRGTGLYCHQIADILLRHGAPFTRNSLITLISRHCGQPRKNKTNQDNQK